MGAVEDLCGIEVRDDLGLYFAGGRGCIDCSGGDDLDYRQSISFRFVYNLGEVLFTRCEKVKLSCCSQLLLFWRW